MLLRAAGALGIDFNTFQDDFDLDRSLPPGAPHVNHFGSVADAVSAKYPSVVFAHRSFAKGEGQQKLVHVEEQLAAGRLVLISLALASFGLSGWHIVPVVGVDDDNLVLLWSVTASGKVDLTKLRKAELVRIHDEYPGGDEVAHLDRY
jgi:hypothetical protein